MSKHFIASQFSLPSSLAYPKSLIGRVKIAQEIKSIMQLSEWLKLEWGKVLLSLSPSYEDVQFFDGFFNFQDTFLDEVEDRGSEGVSFGV